MKIFLLGMPAVGKTTLGKALAVHLTLPFFDLDEEIAKATANTSKVIFESKGEAYFRKIETSVLHTLISDKQTFIMATGGGTPCFYDNLTLMNKVGLTVFLYLPIATLVRRLSKLAIAQRPLLTSVTPSELDAALRNMLQQRMSHYLQAKTIVSKASLTTEVLIKNVRVLF